MAGLQGRGVPVAELRGPLCGRVGRPALTGTCGWALQAKEERLAEEKAKKKAAAKKMEEAEVRRKQEEEARRLRWLQQVRRQGDRGTWPPRER